MSGSQREVFADTAYWIALVDPRQTLHSAAVQASRSLGRARVVTTDLVLVELLNHFCERGEYWRRTVISLVTTITDSVGVVVEPQTRELFDEALEHFKARPDKGYSLTDCASMVVMKRRGIMEALTSDAHFTQEGFTALLLVK